MRSRLLTRSTIRTRSLPSACVMRGAAYPGRARSKVEVGGDLLRLRVALVDLVGTEAACGDEVVDPLPVGVGVRVARRVERAQLVARERPGPSVDHRRAGVVVVAPVV